MGEIFFISGGPCTGKTSVINELRRQGYNTLPEAARELSQIDERFKGKNINQIDRRLFQEEIFNLQKRWIESLTRKKEAHFSDRGFGDTLAHYRLNGFSIPPTHLDYARNFSNHPVFILEPLNLYKMDELRQETPEERVAVHNEIIKAYENLNHNLTHVPVMNTDKRVEFILQKSFKTS